MKLGQEIAKAYFPGWQLAYAIAINFVLIACPTLATPNQVSQTIAQADNSEQQATTNTTPLDVSIEPEILAEINRARTKPQDYALWLEEQRQYYDGVWLKLPGEKPIRTNKGQQALEEAIALLKNQEPLPPLANSVQAAANATATLANFATAHNIQYVSYGRKTASGIVMGLIVDELFPDRRRRQLLLNADTEKTGVACQPDPRYAKVCAISYEEDRNTEIATAPETETTTVSSPQTATIENQVNADQTPEKENASDHQQPASETSIAANNSNSTESDALPVPPLPQPPSSPPEPPNISTDELEDNTESDVASEATPDLDAVAAAAPQMSDLEEELEPDTDDSTIEETPEVSEETESEAEDIEETSDTEEDVAVISEKDDDEDIDEQPDSVADNSELDQEESKATDSRINLESEAKDDEWQEADGKNDSEIADNSTETIEPEDLDLFQNEPPQIATSPENAQLLEKVERGTLEDGDRVISEDGSLYDFFPLEGKAGDSFTIYVESEEFDSFVALVDGQGNTITENDDIDQENSNSRIRITLPEDGVYNIIVNSYDNEGRGRYVLTVSR